MQQPDKNTLAAAMADNPAAVLEEVAHQHNATTRAVLEALPEGLCAFADGAHFADVMTDISRWGDVTFLVHTADVIAEFKGPVPEGKFARGYFNLFGSPFGGHLKADNCAAIAFVRRPFMKSDTLAVWFLDKHGEAMFKIFVGRNEDRSLKADQVERFETLCTTVC